MRVVTWNCCRGSYLAKVARIERLAWDIAIIQECAKPVLESEHCMWFGDNVKQGIAVLARPPYRVAQMPQLEAVPKFVIPVAVSAPGVEFSLFAVWAKRKPPYPYELGSVHSRGYHAHHRYRSFDLLRSDKAARATVSC